MSNNDLGTLASSKRELTFIRYLAALGLLLVEILDMNSI